MIFPMTLDRFHRRMTAVVLVVLVVVLVATMASGAAQAMAELGLPPAVMFALVAVPLVIAWAMAPRALELRARQLRVLRRMWRPLEVPLVDIAGIEDGPRLGVTGALRLAGAGGFFGSYGLFWSRGLGRYRLYATRMGPSVLIRRRDALPLVVTPDDPERFREVLAVWLRGDESIA